MCCDYGFRSGFGRLYQGEDGEIPKNIFQLVSTFLLLAHLRDNSLVSMFQQRVPVGMLGALTNLAFVCPLE